MKDTTKARAPDGLSIGVRMPSANRARDHAPRPKPGKKVGLATAMLAHAPLAMAAMDAGLRLLSWNERAGALFGIPPLLAAEHPPLRTILPNIAGIAPAQQDRIAGFCAERVSASREPAGEKDRQLRLARGQAGWLGIVVTRVAPGAWMVVFDEGPPACGTLSAAPIAADAWLDALTGLGNRRHFNRVLQDTLDIATYESRHAILLLDLNRFAPVNDTLGYSVGDALLCLVAQRLQRESRDGDLLVRLGGDAFAILIRNGDSAAAVAARLGDMLSRPFLVDGHVVTIGASIGVVLFPAHGATADDLMRRVGLALSEAKNARARSPSRHTWRMFEPEMASGARARQAFETDLRKAQALNEFSLAFQAQLHIRTGAVTGFEALLRWTHPARGSVPPMEFIPVAEEIGCIVALGEWVLREACKVAAQWPDGLSVAVNVSPRQFADSERLFAAVHSALRASGLGPERLELEITESSLLAREAHVLETLHRLRACGIRIAMDDFGTGYSSLSQLVSFPFDKIKIDRSFIAGLGRDAEATAVLRAISALGSGLGMTTTAEGVETEAQAALVAADGCTDIQGYLIGRPIPAREIDDFLGEHRPDARPGWAGGDANGFCADGSIATPMGMPA